MADAPTQTNDPVEKEFRRKNLWHSFTSAAYGAIGVASFFGALGMIAQGLVGLAAKAASVEGLGPIAGMAGIISHPLPLAAVGGLVATGLGFTYLAQKEATELRCLQDEHMAHQNAQKIGSNISKEPSLSFEYAQNQRADGKKWEHVVRQNATEERRLH